MTDLPPQPTPTLAARIELQNLGYEVAAARLEVAAASARVQTAEDDLRQARERLKAANAALDAAARKTFHETRGTTE